MKKKIKICCISDCHGKLDFKIPESGLLLIAGDLCPASHDPYISVSIQRKWLENTFKEWLYNQPIEYAIFVPGNHDWIWEYSKHEVPAWFPRNSVDREIRANAKIECIEDYLTFYKGLKIYGTPVQLPFCNWAFNREEGQIQRYWDAIPEGLDILLLHSPPYGILDRTNYPDLESECIGSKSLKKRIEKVRPKLVVFGHNHGEHGVVEKDGIKYVNASLVDDSYRMTRKPILIEMGL